MQNTYNDNNNNDDDIVKMIIPIINIIKCVIIFNSRRAIALLLVLPFWTLYDAWRATISLFCLSFPTCPDINFSNACVTIM